MVHLMEFDLIEIPFSLTLWVLLISPSLPLSIPLLSFTKQVQMMPVRCSSASVTRRQPCVSPRQNSSQLTTTTTRSSVVNKMNTTRSSVVNKMIRTRSSVVNKMTMTGSSVVNNIIGPEALKETTTTSDHPLRTYLIHPSNTHTVGEKMFRCSFVKLFVNKIIKQNRLFDSYCSS